MYLYSMFLETKPSVNQSLKFDAFERCGIAMTIKREDLLHPVVSGNKFRKLKYNFLEAQRMNHTQLLTFGGAYSNHLAATAAAAAIVGLQSVGIVRGDELKNRPRNTTLAYCEEQGMKLHFVSRKEYLNRHHWDFQQTLLEQFGEAYIIPEGGFNELAIKGCEEILSKDDSIFETIAVAVGTGGTMAGIIQSVQPHQKVVGLQLTQDDQIVKRIRTFALHDCWELIQHFEKYAKTTDKLIEFGIDFYDQTGIVLDPIYTGPLMWHLASRLKNGIWKFGTKILMIHTGGLQAIEGINGRLKAQKSSLLWPSYSP